MLLCKMQKRSHKIKPTMEYPCYCCVHNNKNGKWPCSACSTTKFKGRFKERSRFIPILKPEATRVSATKMKDIPIMVSLYPGHSREYLKLSQAISLRDRLSILIDEIISIDMEDNEANISEPEWADCTGMDCEKCAHSEHHQGDCESDSVFEIAFW